jgi:hypothetical protein
MRHSGVLLLPRVESRLVVRQATAAVRGAGALAGIAGRRAGDRRSTVAGAAFVAQFYCASSGIRVTGAVFVRNTSEGM